MIPPSIPAGIPDQAACTDCTAVPSLPDIEAGQGTFHRVLSALIGDVEAKRSVALPVQGAISGEAGLPGVAETAVAAELLRLATLASEGRNAASEPDAVEAGLPADTQALFAEQSMDSALVGAWQTVPLPVSGAVALTEAGPHGLISAQGTVAGQGVAATLAGGRQQLPPSLPAQMSDLQTWQLASVPGQGEAEVVMSPSVVADGTGRSVQHPLQPPTDPPALMASEGPFVLTRTAASREILTMQLPLRGQGWDGELAQRIVWMAGRQAQWAEISLNPPNLGNLEVHLSLKGIEASAYFYSPHAAVREAIDDSLPRLREMLAGAGINLGQTHVGQESFGERRGEGEIRFAARGEAVVAHGALPPVRVGRGLVDLYV